MAINSWANVTLDASVGVKSDRADFRNTVVPGSAAGLNLSVSWDNAVITTLTKWDAAVASARQVASSTLGP